MAILLGYESALEYWRSCASVTDPLRHRALLGDHAERRNATRFLQESLSRADSRRASLAYLSDNPSAQVISVERPIRSRRFKGQKHTFRMLPATSCVLGNLHYGLEPIHVSAPEFTFLQMASKLTLERLIVLGFELCGTYAILGDATTYGVSPLTTPHKLKAFVERESEFKNAARARRALRYVLPKSASPMETCLVMLLCLPYSMGGYGIRLPRLNHRIDIPINLRKYYGRSHCVCDLYWPEHRFGLEYDSDYAHAGINKTAHDAQRRSALESIGVTILSVTRPQVMNVLAFDQLAHMVSKKTRKRIQCKKTEFLIRRSRLREVLLRG